MYILIILLLTLSCDHYTYTTTTEYQEETEWNKETGEITTKPNPNISVKWEAQKTL